MKGTYMGVAKQGTRRSNHFQKTEETKMAANKLREVLENQIKGKIRGLLKRYEVYWYAHAPSGMGQAGVDFYCCVNGLFLAIEAKRPGGEPTDLQAATLMAVIRAGGAAMVVRDDVSLLRLEEYLRGAINYDALMRGEAEEKWLSKMLREISNYQQPQPIKRWQPVAQSYPKIAHEIAAGFESTEEALKKYGLGQNTTAVETGNVLTTELDENGNLVMKWVDK